MPKEKVQRNEEFKNAWRKEGLSNKELGERFNLSIGGVKGLKQRLRAKDSSLYEKPRVDKLISEHITKSPSQQVYKRATYYLTPEMVKKIKFLAIRKDKDASGLMREILKEYLSRQSDL